MTTQLEKIALAISQEIKRQMDGGPTPGPLDPEKWTATGGEIELTQVARAVVEAMRGMEDAVLAVEDSLYGDLRPEPEEWTIQHSRDAWEAGIDAILTEKDAGPAPPAQSR